MREVRLLTGCTPPVTPSLIFRHDSVNAGKSISSIVGIYAPAFLLPMPHHKRSKGNQAMAKGESGLAANKMAKEAERLGTKV